MSRTYLLGSLQHEVTTKNTLQSIFCNIFLVTTHDTRWPGSEIEKVRKGSSSIRPMPKKLVSVYLFVCFDVGETFTKSRCRSLVVVHMSTSNLPQPSWSQPNAVPSSYESGDIHDTQQESHDDSFLTQPYSTLDEPVTETIMRDVRAVGSKLKIVLLPLDKTVCRVFEWENGIARQDIF